MVSYAGLDSEQIQALRLEAQQLARGSPADLAEKQIGLLYEEDIHDATKRILDGIKERGDGATKQEQTVLDHFSVALDWIKAAEEDRKSVV